MTDIAAREIAGEIDFTRGRGFFDPTTCRTPVTIVGCGGIGSSLALALAKMGVPNLTLIDADEVEKHNLPNQLFPLEDKGRAKVDSVADVCRAFGVSEVRAFNEMVTETNFPGGRPRGIVILALDSIDTRRMIWERHIKRNIGVTFLIDPRLGGQSVVMFTCDPRNMREAERYEGSFFDASEASPAPCTMRSIIDVMFSVTSLIVRAVRLNLAGETVEHTLFWNHKRLRASVGIDEHSAELS